LLDTTLVLADGSSSVDDINSLMRRAAQEHPDLIAVTDDPIVSSDVLGCKQSLLFDTQATLKAGQHFYKTLAWYETRGHAARMLDVAQLYAGLTSEGDS
ncbi:MAG: glyceraldehyde-3-phosphate dehydrogenase, partial [Pseudomonadota bacterium]